MDLDDRLERMPIKMHSRASWNWLQASLRTRLEYKRILSNCRNGLIKIMCDWKKMSMKHYVWAEIVSCMDTECRTAPVMETVTSNIQLEGKNTQWINSLQITHSLLYMDLMPFWSASFQCQATVFWLKESLKEVLLGHASLGSSDPML